MGRDKFLRLIAPSLLLCHLLCKVFISSTSIAIDLVAYCVVPISLIIVVALSQRFSGKLWIISTLALWTLASALSTLTQFISLPEYTNSAITAVYILFYLLFLLTLGLLLIPPINRNATYILDGVIVALGLFSLSLSFGLTKLLPAIRTSGLQGWAQSISPIADYLLLSVTLALALLSANSLRNNLISLAIVLFVLFDFLYIWKEINGSYQFGSIADDGWLLSFLILFEGVRHKVKDRKIASNIYSLLITLAIFSSATLLAVSSLHTQLIPTYARIPIIATLLLSLLRMVIALVQTTSIGEERMMARTDELTGIPNRRQFMAHLNAFTKAKEVGALLLLDLDSFKPINDEHGHATGDRLLKEISQRFMRALPEGSILARLGGDEFAVIVRGNSESTIEVARALRATLSYPFPIFGHAIRVGVSIGHIQIDSKGDLLRRADLAMYQAKRENLGVYSGSVLDFS